MGGEVQVVFFRGFGLPNPPRGWLPLRIPGLQEGSVLYFGPTNPKAPSFSVQIVS